MVLLDDGREVGVPVAYLSPELTPRMADERRWPDTPPFEPPEEEVDGGEPSDHGGEATDSAAVTRAALVEEADGPIDVAEQMDTLPARVFFAGKGGNVEAGRQRRVFFE